MADQQEQERSSAGNAGDGDAAAGATGSVRPVSDIGMTIAGLAPAMAPDFDAIFDAWDAPPETGPGDLDALIDGAANDLASAFGDTFDAGEPAAAAADPAAAEPRELDAPPEADPEGTESELIHDRI